MIALNEPADRGIMISEVVVEKCWLNADRGIEPSDRRKDSRRLITAYAIVEKITADLTSPEFVAEALQSTRKLLGRDHNAAIAQLRSKEAEIQIRIDRFLELAAKLDSPDPVLRKVDDLERERLRVASEIARLEEENKGAGAVATLTEANVSRMLSNLPSELETSDREAMKDFGGEVLERVELDPNAMTCQLFYRISPTYRNKLASPRDAEPITIVNSTPTRLT